MTVESTVTVTAAEGLHARPAAACVAAANRFASSIELLANGQTVNAKSILGILKLGLRCGETLTIRATGEDAQAAVAELSALLASPPAG